MSGCVKHLNKVIQSHKDPSGDLKPHELPGCLYNPEPVDRLMLHLSRKPSTESKLLLCQQRVNNDETHLVRFT